MSILLDTNAVIAIMTDRPESVRRRYRKAQQSGEQISISSITLFELWFGVAKSDRWQENANRLRDFLEGPINVASFSSDDAQAAGELRAELKKLGTPLGPYDLLIAAQSRRAGAILVTANDAEFGMVEGLEIQNWVD